MKAWETTTLIDTIQTELRRQLERCAELRQRPLQELHARPEPKRWSAMEVIQHMNLSSGHYYRRLQKLYADDNNCLRYHAQFRPGRWGDHSTNAMDPKADGSISWRMKTMAMFEPRNISNSGYQALDEFEVMLNGFISLLELARTRGLEGEKVTSTLGPILRFKVGDAFRFPIAHQTRHFLQIDRFLC